MDLQAQDRAHRIGQTKPVLVFRLVSAHTIETKIMQRAAEKRQLEALVIAKGPSQYLRNRMLADILMNRQVQDASPRSRQTCSKARNHGKDGRRSAEARGRANSDRS